MTNEATVIVVTEGGVVQNVLNISGSEFVVVDLDEEPEDLMVTIRELPKRLQEELGHKLLLDLMPKAGCPVHYCRRCGDLIVNKVVMQPADGLRNPWVCGDCAAVGD